MATQPRCRTTLISLCAWVLLTALAAQAQSGRGNPGQPTQKQPANDCAASGTVVNAITGEPISRAMVSIVGVTGEAGAATDEKGQWAISNLTCGMRLPTATHDGFLPGNENAAGAEAEKRMIQLVSGSPVSNVKIALTPGGVITGTVRDSYGDPLRGSQVRVMRVKTQSGKRGLSQAESASSDAEGNFRIDGLERGSYVVCAGSQQVTYPVGGGEPLIFSDYCFPGPLETALLTPLRLEPGREMRTALTLTAAHGAHVRGRISGIPAATADTAPRIGIDWIKATNSSYTGTGNHSVRSDGTFDIAPVQPGSYMASAWGARGASSALAQARLDVGSADIDNLVLALQPAARITGTVRYELSHATSGPGAIHSANPNLRIEIRPPEGTINYGMPNDARWDADRLNFVFDSLVADRYKIKVSLQSETLYVKSATLKGQDVQKQAFGAEGTTGPIEIVISDDTGGVDALVNSDDGKPVTAYVVLIPADGQERILVSRDDGHAKAGSIPTGEYRAWAFDDIDSVPYAEPDWMARNAGPGEKVTVTTGGTAKVTLKKTAASNE